MKKILILFVLLMPMTGLILSCGSNSPTSTTSAGPTSTPTNTPTPSIKTLVSSFSSYSTGVSITGMCVDSSDNLYVANRNGNGSSSNLMKVNSAGTPTDLFTINSIDDVVYDGTNWYVSTNTSPDFVFFNGTVTSTPLPTGITSVHGVAINSGATTMALATNAGVSFYSLPAFTGLGVTSYPSGSQSYGSQILAFDNSGNFYLAMQNMVVKYSTSSGASTIAGSNTAGYTDGVGSAAAFNSIFAISVDKNSNVYVADNGNLAIREISGTTVTTLLGPTHAGVSPAFTTPALNSPEAIAVDNAGNVFIGDQSGSGTTNAIYEYIP